MDIESELKMFKIKNIFTLLFVLLTLATFSNDLLLKAEIAYETSIKTIESYEELIKDGYVL